jgi:hypothetical protein
MFVAKLSAPEQLHRPVAPAVVGVGFLDRGAVELDEGVPDLVAQRRPRRVLVVL